MPKAAACIQHCHANVGQVSIGIAVSSDAGDISLDTSFNVNFASSTNQMNADIKQKVVTILAGYGANLAVNDVVVFGGPS